MIGFFLSMFFFVLTICAFISVIIFVIDVFRWHDREEKVIITPSAHADLIESEVITDDKRNIELSRGDDPASSDTDRTSEGQSDTSALSSSWLRS